MTDAEQRTSPEEPDAGGESLDEGVRDLLKSALSDQDAPPTDVLSGVQRKLRQRSHGKFYADRWSTATQPPVLTYLITSLVMLAIAFVIYAVLSPLRGRAVEIDNAPAPVRVMPPQ